MGTGDISGIMTCSYQNCDGGRNGAMDEHNDTLPRMGMMDSWVYRSGYRS